MVFSGTETDSCLESLYAVSLPRGADAVGKMVADIDWALLRVELRAIRRGAAEVEHPGDDWIFRAGDILLVAGKPRRFEKVEAKLLHG